MRDEILSFLSQSENYDFNGTTPLRVGEGIDPVIRVADDGWIVEGSKMFTFRQENGDELTNSYRFTACLREDNGEIATVDGGSIVLH